MLVLQSHRFEIRTEIYGVSHVGAWEPVMKGVLRVGARKERMQKKNNSLRTEKVSFAVLAFLLCVGMLAGCGRDNPKQGDNRTAVTEGAAAAVSVTATSSPTPTATPTPTVPFVQRTYETVGRDDVYRVPVKEVDEGQYLMSTRCAGEYALLWFSPSLLGEEDEAVDSLVLIRPAVSEERYRVSFDYPIATLRLLADGTVILEETATGCIHVFDNTLEETGHFLLSEMNGTVFVDASEDDILWIADDANGKLLAYDLKGQPAGEYSYDTKYRLTRYLGSRNGQKFFLAAQENADVFVYYVIPADGSEMYCRSESEDSLGDEWRADRYAPMRAPINVNADATWFFHEPGALREGVAFPKRTANEEICFVQGNSLCSNNYRWTGPETCLMDFRLYDMEKRTVSEVLSGGDIPDCSYASVRGTVGDGIVLIVVSRVSGGEEILLWNAGEKTTPITGFCDFSKDDLAGCLAELLKEAEEQYNIVITPDRTEDDGTLGSLGDFMSEFEFVNSFLLAAKNNPEVLKSESGEAIHPENMSNNDGAHYTFNPHVFSTFYLKEHGEKRRDAFYAYVDALRAGEDGFRCPNEGDAAWSSGRYAMMFFPFAGLYADAEYVGNGWAEITYKIPKEEFLAKEREFEARIEEILNDVLEDDYTDFEKALALYEFLTEYSVYDYDMMAHNGDETWTSRQSSYRVLTEKQGVCGEIAMLYQYLGLQCGIDVDEVVGAAVEYGADSHAWNYILLDGTGYLIDATWGLTDNHKPDLKYFLFTDELRETRDGYRTDSCDVGFCGMYGARKKFSFECNDEHYSELWEGYFIAFDENEKCIFYRDRNGSIKRFDYGR